MFELTVTNTLTGDTTLVATFSAQGDLFIAMNALQAAAPKHLVYDVKSSKPSEWIFDWVDGGWNSIMAVNKTDAIAAARAKYGDGKIQISSIRPATPKEWKRLLSEFY
jgi:hypothetical protein